MSNLLEKYEIPLVLGDFFSTPLIKGLAKGQSLMERFATKGKSSLDKIGKEMQVFGKTIDRVVRGSHKTLNDLNTQLDKLKEKRMTLRVNSKEMRDANRDIQSLEDRIARAERKGQKGGGLLGGILGGVGRGVLPLLAAGTVATAGGSIVNKGMEREQTELRFGLMAGSEGKGIVRGLNRYADITPFENDEIIRAGQVMLPAFKSNEIVPRVAMLGNIAAGSDVPIDEIARGYTKAKNNYYVQNDILDLFEKTPIVKYLAEVLKVKEQDVKSLAEKNKVTFNDLDKALFKMQSAGGVFANMTDRLAETAGGKLSTLMGTLNERLTQLGLKALPWINVGIERLNEMLDGGGSLSVAMDSVFDAGTSLLEILGSLGGSLGLVKTNAGQAASAMDGVSSIFNLIAGLGTVVSDFAASAKKMLSYNPVEERQKGWWGEVKNAIPGYNAYRSLEAFYSGGKENEAIRQNATGKKAVNQYLDRILIGQEQGNPLQPGKGPLAPAGKGVAWKPSGLNGPGKDSGKGVGKAAGLEGTVSGAKSQNITINIAKMVEKFEVHTATVNESGEQIRDYITTMLVQGIQSAAAMAN